MSDKICINQFKSYSEFKTKDEFNSNNEMFLASHKEDFSPTEYIAFKRLMRVSCNVKEGVFGVTFISINRLVEYINEYDLQATGISRSTVKRMIKKAKDLGIIKVFERAGKNGRQTSNLYVFQKFGQAKPQKRKKVTDSNVKKSITIDPPQTAEEQPKKVDEVPIVQQSKNVKQLNHLDSSILFNTNNLNIRIEKANEEILHNKNIDLEFIKPNVPEKFVRCARVFYNDALVIEEYWKMAQIAAKKISSDIAEFDLIAVAIDSFKETIRGIKINKVRKNSFAFFYGTILKMLKKLYAEFYKPKKVFSQAFKGNFYGHSKAKEQFNLGHFEIASREELNALGVY